MTPDTRDPGLPIDPVDPTDSMDPPPSPDPIDPIDPTDTDEELPLPTGTLFFVMIYLMVMAGMWGAIYFDFLGR